MPAPDPVEGQTPSVAVGFTVLLVIVAGREVMWGLQQQHVQQRRLDLPQSLLDTLKCAEDRQVSIRRAYHVAWQRHGITSTSSLVLWSLVAVACGVTSMPRFGLAI